MTLTSKIHTFARRKKLLTTRHVADRFGVPSNMAGAYTCNMAKAGLLRKKKKMRGMGMRWYWLFEVR